MINRISNIEELRAEKMRLRLKKQLLEEAMKNDVSAIKKKLDPFHFFTSKTDDIKEGKSGFANDLFGTSLAFVLDLLFTRFLLRKSNFIKKTVLSLLIQMAGSKIFAAKSEAILASIKKFMEKLKAEQKTEPFDSTTAAEEY